MISILTHGDSSDGPSPAAGQDGSGETSSTTTPGSPGGSEYGGRASGAGSSGVVATGGGGAGLASMVELQEKEIAGLREELSEALSRVPRGGGEGGGVSALEEALRKQVQRC